MIKKGKNYTLFNSHRKDIKFVGSRLMYNQSQRSSFLDFENEKVENVYSFNDTNYDKKIAHNNMLRIRDTVINASTIIDVEK